MLRLFVFFREKAIGDGRSKDRGKKEKRKGRVMMNPAIGIYNL